MHVDQPEARRCEDWLGQDLPVCRHDAKVGDGGVQNGSQ
jgi:hypothetical protein